MRTIIMHFLFTVKLKFSNKNFMIYRIKCFLKVEEQYAIYMAFIHIDKTLIDKTLKLSHYILKKF